MRRFEKQLVIDISGMNEWFIQEIEQQLSEMRIRGNTFNLTVRREE